MMRLRLSISREDRLDVGSSNAMILASRSSALPISTIWRCPIDRRPHRGCRVDVLAEIAEHGVGAPRAGRARCQEEEPRRRGS